ncbi:DUF4168 domain-containing protein [Microbulbifer thermotolerans]|uniref:DUF4168 domain-containing protein n=1 Tax=Microbulbifer thermotolerans TaxID=252514 RepID=UPI00224997E1|nr:DUF4168 domain-containing protein [Microbulbifer thermotolerans]MCX2782169.1 DUF4168 domain-containing protein [Microbulbifer thermotolerans]MCX2831326.1 DUF4168 domain-containing protein [Microbulbifer thermotolerans]
MKTLAICLSILALLLSLPLAQAQTDTTQPAAREVSYSEPKLQQFANAYRAIVELSREYAPKLKAAADIEEAEAINREAQGKMIEAIRSAGLTKEEYQQIAGSLKSDPALVEKVNKMLQKDQR